MKLSDRIRPGVECAPWVYDEVCCLEAERDRLASSLTAIEDEKNSYLDYVGDALGQAADGESLWDAAQRVLSERDRLRAELAECQRLLHRYRNETPLGHQPHMIAHEVDAALAAKGEGK